MFKLKAFSFYKFILDDISTTTSDGLYKTDKLNATFFSNTASSLSSSVSNNSDETKSKSTTTFINSTSVSSSTETGATAFSIQGLFNISSNNNIINSSNFITTSTTTTSAIFTNTISTNNASIIPQNVSTTTEAATGATFIASETPTIIATSTTNYNTTTITATTNAITDARGRSAALERAYVHDVYENCEEPTSGPIRPRVAQFLANLEPGSIVCDVGCGNGRYLTSCNPLICTIGVDRCYRLTKIAREKGGEVSKL